MRTVPEFIHGSITQDFQGILDAEPLTEAASDELAAKAQTPAKTGSPVCKQEKPQSGKTCTDKAPCKTKKEAASFVPGVEGWSIPPAPPAF
jgi:hypothetical protein